MKRISTTTAQSAQDVLVLGFDNHSYILLNEQDGMGYYAFKSFDNSFKAFAHLEDKINQNPVAIICSYEFLRDESFRFLHALTANASYKNIPFIVISAEGLDIPIQEALKMGIDDCYTEPVNWSNLKKRVAFLQKYKEDLLEPIEEAADDTYHYQTPFGKRVFDCVVAMTVIIAFSPILLFIILAIKVTSPGPIIYRSKRVGQGYNAFD